MVNPAQHSAFHLTGVMPVKASWRLREAAGRGDVTGVEEQVKVGVDVDDGGDSLRTALHAAASRGRGDVVRVLLEAGANPNIRTKTGGETALHQAAQHGFQDIVVELLRAGSDWRLKTATGWTALHCAMNAGKTDVARALIRSGADPHLKNDRGIAAKDVATHCDVRDIDAILEVGRWGKADATLVDEPEVERHTELRSQNIAARIQRTQAHGETQKAATNERRELALERQRACQERQNELQFNFSDTVRANAGVLKADVDYGNLPEGFIPEGMTVMNTVRIRHQGGAFDPSKRTSADRKTERSQAVMAAARARAAKEIALQKLGDAAQGASNIVMLLSCRRQCSLLCIPKLLGPFPCIMCVHICFVLRAAPTSTERARAAEKEREDAEKTAIAARIAAADKAEAIAKREANAAADAAKAQAGAVAATKAKEAAAEAAKAHAAKEAAAEAAKEAAAAPALGPTPAPAPAPSLAPAPLPDDAAVAEAAKQKDAEQKEAKAKAEARVAEEEEAAAAAAKATAKATKPSAEEGEAPNKEGAGPPPKKAGGGPPPKKAGAAPYALIPAPSRTYSPLPVRRVVMLSSVPN